MQTVTNKFTKLQSVQGSEWVRHVYQNEFSFENTSSKKPRICVTTSAGYVDLILALAATLPEPFFILYVLILSRKQDNEAARYQSDKVSYLELKAFLERFEDYFENDGRHHIWIHSPESSATLVYDNHNLLYGYGPLETFSTVLRNKGLKNVEEIQRVAPHGHCYNQEFDSCEGELLGSMRWKKSPLQPQDDPR
jgi:hypothetical protein